ncbi:hypothetical protein F0A17_20355 [Billgrantia pellis]|uniref:DUF3718 domain-containing protein n=1 Tax=Billgrantia pellis TaxID=2606936 RepID=A0A7V7KFV2_9GAMM|nr:hypothetical protein [Halomonas pellis]KAA0009661.1 hypothetical protein F0A17_20355 [Halomonas pellis]
MLRLRMTPRRMRLCVFGTLLLSLSWTAQANDYPTEARVDYVLGCMAANGNSYLTMQKCSCSIDVIAEHLPYKTYEQVETVLGMQDQRGELGVLFRTERGMQDQIDALHQAQADANLRCF